MYRGERKRHFGLKFLLIEIVGVLIISGIVTAYGVYTKPVYADDAPSELKTLPESGYLTSETGKTLIVLESDGIVEYNSNTDTIRVRVFFENPLPEAVGQGVYWYGTNASLEVKIKGTSNKIEGTPLYTSRTWGSTITFPTMFATPMYNPCLTGVWPINEENNHQNIKLTARMNVYYPNYISGSSDIYETQNKTITQEFNLFVVSPAELQLKSQIENYSNLSGVAVGLSFLWIVLVGPVVFLIYARIYNRGAQLKAVQ